MRQASRFFTEEQRKRIEQCVADAEAKTSAEIVPVVATASGRYDRPEDIAGLWLGMILLAVTWLFFPRPEASAASGWGLDLTQYQLPALLGAMLLGFVVGAIFTAKIGWLRRWFTSRRQMQDEVGERAGQMFFDNSIHRTSGGTGLLVYVSLFERMAAIIGDETVMTELGQEMLDELCRQLTDGLHSGDATDAICALIENAGEFLGSVLPREEGDANELDNALILVDD
jgi:putative membrane protein